MIFNKQEKAYLEYISLKPPKTAKQHLFVYEKYIKGQKNPEALIKLANLSDISKNNYLSIFKNYLEYTNQTEKLSKLTMIKVKGNNKSVPSWYYKMDSIIRWLTENHTDSPEILAFLIMARTGLRAEEILETDWSNVKTSEIKVLTKGNKWKYIFLPKINFALLEKLNSLNYDRLNYFGHKLTKTFELEEAFTPHQCRYLYANNLKTNFGLTKYQIMDLMAHDDIATTLRYLFDDIDELRDLNNRQYDESIEAIQKMEKDLQLDMYKNLYNQTFKLLQKEILERKIRDAEK